MGYNSACVRDICEIFASISAFSRLGHRMLRIRNLALFFFCLKCPSFTNTLVAYYCWFFVHLYFTR